MAELYDSSFLPSCLAWYTCLGEGRLSTRKGGGLKAIIAGEEGFRHMRIRITWNRPDGSKPAVEFPVDGADPQMDVAKAAAAASPYFYQKFGEMPTPGELTAKMVTG